LSCHDFFKEFVDLILAKPGNKFQTFKEMAYNFTNQANSGKLAMILELCTSISVTCCSENSFDSVTGIKLKFKWHLDMPCQNKRQFYSIFQFKKSITFTL